MLSLLVCAAKNHLPFETRNTTTRSPLSFAPVRIAICRRELSPFLSSYLLIYYIMIQLQPKTVNENWRKHAKVQCITFEAFYHDSRIIAGRECENVRSLVQCSIHQFMPMRLMYPFPLL